jgi:AraC-like DNA-binding protein
MKTSNAMPLADISREEVSSDRPGERLLVQRSSQLPGVEFWTVLDSTRHWAMHHDTFTASLVLGSRAAMNATWRYRGQEQVVSPGCLQLMEPGEVHRTTRVSAPASFFVIWWQPRLLADSAASLGASSSVHLKYAQTEHPRLQSAFLDLHASIQRNGDAAEVEAHFVASTHLLLELCGEHQLPARPRGTHPAIRKVRAKLHDEYMHPLSLDQLAREVGLSKFHVARCFKEATGVAPHQYQKLVRLQSARRHIERGVCVREAAAAAGFADEAHLSRSFRAWLGISPGSWRRSAVPRKAFALPSG